MARLRENNLPASLVKQVVKVPLVISINPNKAALW